LEHSEILENANVNKKYKHKIISLNRNLNFVFFCKDI
jgi:hypothetical protein